MSDTIKVNVASNEELSTSEREEQVLTDAGVNTQADDGTYKVDLSKPAKQEEDAIQEQSTDDSNVVVEESENTESSEAVVEEVRETEEEAVLEEVQVEAPAESETVTEEEVMAELETKPEIDLPENIQKVVEFMNETGGSLEDYVRLNQDFDSMSEDAILDEYYKNTKSHLDKEERDFLIEDSFSYDEDMDDERDIKRKKLAYKEEIAKAKEFLRSQKEKYYNEVKLGSKLPPEQQKAIDFFNRYNKEQSELQKQQQMFAERFNKETENVFNKDFKGFDFNVGDKTFRFNVKDAEAVKSTQSDLSKVVGKFLDENGALKDGKGYHKALFAANNADGLAQHFYQQGRADAIKQLESESKNINMDPRKTSGTVDAGGVKVRAISGDDGSKLKFRIKQ